MPGAQRPATAGRRSAFPARRPPFRRCLYARKEPPAAREHHGYQDRAIVAAYARRAANVALVPAALAWSLFSAWILRTRCACFSSV